MTVTYADDAKAHLVPTLRTAEVKANTAPGEKTKYIAVPATSGGTADAFRIKHGARYEVKEAIRNTVDQAFGMTRGRSAMPTLHITRYNTRSTSKSH